MGDGWQSTSNRPILNILAASDGLINVRRAFDASGQDKNMPFIANSMVDVSEPDRHTNEQGVDESDDDDIDSDSSTARQDQHWLSE